MRIVARNFEIMDEISRAQYAPLIMVTVMLEMRAGEGEPGLSRDTIYSQVYR